MNVLTPETQVSMTAVNKRKAILPLKYGRFMQFGYFLLDKWCEGMDRSTVEANTTKFLDLLRVYNTVEEQTEWYQLFLNNADGMMRDSKCETILPLKYRRFMQFGYFLLDKWCEGTVEANTTKFLDLLRVYNTVENQTELYQLFLNNADDIGSTLKTMVRDRKKALTKNAPHKSRTKKVVDTVARENDMPKKRHGKDKVVKFVSAEQKLIDELIRLANERVADAHEG